MYIYTIIHIYSYRICEFVRRGNEHFGNIYNLNESSLVHPIFPKNCTLSCHQRTPHSKETYVHENRPFKKPIEQVFLLSLLVYTFAFHEQALTEYLLMVFVCVCLCMCAGCALPIHVYIYIYKYRSIYKTCTYTHAHIHTNMHMYKYR